MHSYQFPRQKVLCDEKPYSRELLRSLLEVVYSSSVPFTGYLKVAGIGSDLHFLFFLKGAPYAAGRYQKDKPVGYSIQDFGRILASSDDKARSITLCQTDPILLKCMLLFLQTEPDIKAPTSLIDIERIVRHFAEEGNNVIIALCRDRKISFFFKAGKRALAYYSDMAFKRPEGMNIDEEIQLYAFQRPEEIVQAFIFRDMPASKAADVDLYNKDLLFTLLTVGYLKNKRRGDGEVSPATVLEIDKVLAVPQEPSLSSVVLSIESGPQQGGCFTVTLPCVIGRNNCDLVLDDNHISRRHAELKLVENTLVIEDLASRNGTRVNGEKITVMQLNPNDLITIGPINLRVSPA
ncbi:MAG: FHA domain-containing protein [Geobacter sp.]|nr:MAG: FHA domain-containing protein [Geobacter sp.]